MRKSKTRRARTILLPSDFKFTVLDVPMSTRYVLARYLAYDRQTDFRIVRRPTVEAMQTVDTVARLKWRRFLERMRDAGWDRLQHEGVYRYARNCPPVGITTNKQAFPCDAFLVCPYCNARRAMDLFMRLETVLWGGFEPHAKPRQDLDVVSFVRQTPNDVCRDRNERDGGDPRPAIMEYALRLRANRRIETTRINHVGGFVAHRVDWLGRRQNAFPRFCRGGVVLVPRDAYVPMPEDAAVKRMGAIELTKNGLLEMVRDVCRFPFGWFKAAPSKTLDYLRIFNDQKTVSTFGLLRSRSVDQEEDS